MHCAICGKNPSECPRAISPIRPPEFLALDATPILDGGHVGAEHVSELYLGYAMRITEESDSPPSFKHTQLAHALQLFVKYQQEQQAAEAPLEIPGAEREKLRRQNQPAYPTDCN